MTSNKGAGYKESQKSFDPLNQANSKVSPDEAKVLSIEEQMKESEKAINKALEESAVLLNQGKNNLALEKAKDSLNKDRTLRKLRETNNMVDQINTDLTFAVCLNLANM
mmetsp:Transcript_32737/g.71369  ORF Transcript_32737/g.71369 Transcript_32737/m.71369 type:complete len:109 (-) Transcript_32737:1881-2207(-)